MGRVYKAEFRREPVRLALSSSLSRERIAEDRRTRLQLQKNDATSSTMSRVSPCVMIPKMPNPTGC